MWRMFQGVHKQERIHQPPPLTPGQDYLQILRKVLLKSIKSEQAHEKEPSKSYWVHLILWNKPWLGKTLWYSWMENNQTLAQDSTGLRAILTLLVASTAVLSVAKLLVVPLAWLITRRPTQDLLRALYVGKQCQESVICRGIWNMFTQSTAVSRSILKAASALWTNKYKHLKPAFSYRPPKPIWGTNPRLFLWCLFQKVSSSRVICKPPEVPQWANNLSPLPKCILNCWYSQQAHQKSSQDGTKWHCIGLFKAEIYFVWYTE